MVDEPEALGGKGSGPSPLAHFLGALVGCTQITLHTIAKEQGVSQQVTFPLPSEKHIA